MSQTPFNPLSGYNGSDQLVYQTPPQQPTGLPQQTSQPGIFKRVLATGVDIAGIAGSVLAPGLGGAFGGLLSRSVLGGGQGRGMSDNALSSMIDQGSDYGPSADQYLNLAKQMNAQSEAFEAVTNVMKSKHSSTMNVIQNMGS